MDGYKEIVCEKEKDDDEESTTSEDRFHEQLVDETLVYMDNPINVPDDTYNLAEPVNVT